MGTADNQLQRKLDNATTPILGQGGITLAEQWDPEPVAYLSLAVPKMPNMFQLFGPNSAPVAGSISHTMEGACGFVIKCITKLQQEYLKSIVPRLVDLGLFFSSFPSPPPSLLLPCGPVSNESSKQHKSNTRLDESGRLLDQ
jgi:hypothetical protein